MTEFLVFIVGLVVGFMLGYFSKFWYDGKRSTQEKIDMKMVLSVVGGIMGIILWSFAMYISITTHGEYKVDTYLHGIFALSIGLPLGALFQQKK